MMNNQTADDSFIRYINISINLFYLIFGNIGNLFKIGFFLQKPLRSLPCTVYILFSTFNDFITLNNLPVLQLLIDLYPKYHWIKINLDWSNHPNETILISYSISTYDIIICKTRTYLHMLSTNLSFQMLLFASINRFYSSHRRRKRQNNPHYLIKHFCDYPNIYKLCIISSTISALLALQHVFNFTINSPLEGCIPNNRILWTIWITFIHCFLLPILMIIFGILTLKNNHFLSMFSDYFHRLQCYCLRHNHRKRKYQFHEICSDCSRRENSIQYKADRQLTLMIISEICVTVLTSLPYGIYAFYHLLYEIQGRTIYYTNRTKWITLFIRITMYFEASCGFYIYLLTLTTLRKRFCKIFIKNLLSVYNHCRIKFQIVDE